MKKKRCIAATLIAFTLAAIAEAQVILKTCSRDNLFTCPQYSLCTQISNDENEDLKCICIESFQLNPNWFEYENLNSSMLLLQEHYCLASDKASRAGENKIMIYMRSPARKEHLVFGILMVLLAATLATAVLYGLKVLRLIKRTKSLYHKLRYKRRITTPLQEMDELDLNRRYEIQTL